MQRCLAHTLTVAAALVAAGCGANAVPEDDVGAAAGATKAQGSARVETVSRTSFDSEEVVVRSIGVVDYANERREEEIQAPAAGDSSPRSLRVITIGSVTWSEIPDGDALPPGSKRWLRADAAEAEKLLDQGSTETSEDGSVASMRLIFSAPETSPDEFLDYLDGVAPDPKRIGEERVRGIETTHYRTQLDLERATRRDLERKGWAEPNIERVLEEMDGGSSDIDIWIGADGLIRRIVSGTEATGEPSMSFEMTTEFFDFGVEVDIQPPPPGEVMDQEEWLRQVNQEQQDWLDDQIVGERP